MKKCNVCGAICEDEAVFCGSCGCSLDTSSDADAVAETFPNDSSPKKKKRVWLIGVIVVIAALIVAAVGMLTNWFGLVSPLHGLIKATERTLKSESLTAKITMKNDDDKAAMDVRAIVDQKDKKLIFFAENKYGKILYTDSEVYYMSDDYAYIEDLDMEDEFFDVYDKTLNAEEEPDWKDILKKLDVDDYVDHKKVQDLLTTVYKEYLCNGEWLEEVAGFEKNGDVYTFKPDVEKLLEDVIDLCDDSDAFSKTAKKEIKSALEDAIDLAEDNDFTLTISVTVKGGKLNLIEVKSDGKYPDAQIKATLQLTDINKTKISDDEIEDFQDDVEEMIEENTCPECGDTLFWYDDDEHGDCDSCGKHGYLYQYEGHNYCYNCNEKAKGYGNCDRCGDYEYMYSLNGSEYCADCYYYYRNYSSSYSSSYQTTYGYCDLCNGYGILYKSPYTNYWYCYDCYDDYGYF